MEDFFHSWLFFTLLGFCSGSVMYSYEIPKLLKNVDVRESAPDGNPGGMNAMRAAGTEIGLLCIALDVLKAFLPVFAAVSFADLRGPALAAVVTAPVAGHAFSPFLKFRGGKAVSPFFGAMLGLWPVSRIFLLPAAAMLLFKFLAVIQPDSLCMCAGLFAACVASFFLEPKPDTRAAFFLAQAVVLFKVSRSPDPGPASIRVGRRERPLQNHGLKFHKP